MLRDVTSKVVREKHGVTVRVLIADPAAFTASSAIYPNAIVQAYSAESSRTAIRPGKAEPEAEDGGSGNRQQPYNIRRAPCSQLLPVF